MRTIDAFRRRGAGIARDRTARDAAALVEQAGDLADVARPITAELPSGRRDTPVPATR